MVFVAARALSSFDHTNEREPSPSPWVGARIYNGGTYVCTMLLLGRDSSNYYCYVHVYKYVYVTAVRTAVQVARIRSNSTIPGMYDM